MSLHTFYEEENRIFNKTPIYNEEKIHIISNFKMIGNEIEVLASGYVIYKKWMDEWGF